jgi:hypothetical protein
MNHVDFSELVLPFLKVETSTAAYDVLCKVNKLFNTELKTERDTQSAEKWFRKSAEFFDDQSIYYLDSARINSSVHFTIITCNSRGSDEETHKGIVSFNNDNTVSMCVTSEANKDGEIVSRTFPNIKSLDMLKTIFIENNFHSYDDDEDEDDGEEGDEEDDEEDS